jgi:intracellular septation protein
MSCAKPENAYSNSLAHETCVKLAPMNSVLELFPILIFVAAYYMADIFTATALAIAASLLQVSVFWFRDRKVKKKHLITLVMIAFFGGLTLVLQDEIFIKWKFTVVSWLFGIFIFGSQFIGEKTIIERLMGASFELPQIIWRRANAATAALMMLEGIINIYVMYNYDTETWFNIKFYGMTAMTIVFMFALGFYLAQYVKEETEVETIKQDEER